MCPPLHSFLEVRELPDGPEPVAAFERLRGRGTPWLLDSALRSRRLGRFSFAGAEPWAVLRAHGRRAVLECRRPVLPGTRPGCSVFEADPLDTLRDLLPRLDPSLLAPELPFVGGAVGFFGYEIADLYEALGPEPGEGSDASAARDDSVWLLVDSLLAWDHEAGRAFAVGLGFGADAAAARRSAEAGAARALSWLDGELPAAAAARACARRRRGGHFDAARYGKAVREVLDEIGAGRVYQACLTHRMEWEFGGDPWDLYRRLRRVNPAPFAAYLELPELAVVGSSPERFLCVDAAGRAESRPIKGTRPRGRHTAEDAALRVELAESPKDRAENLMIVDLVRNDLGRACRTGSVEVPELMAVEEYAAVFQMVSTVTGRLRPDRDVFDLVRTSFPPGSMTGAPKIAAMRLLKRLEPVPRGVYSGALGYLDARGGADLSVVIRSILVRDGRAQVHTGGGVVADSDPQEEWRESLDKARPLRVALEEEG